MRPRPDARRAVFLDRDGVINRVILRHGRPHPPRSLKEWSVFPFAEASLQRLRRAGFLLIVVTNQPDVAMGHQRRALVEAIHAQMRRRLPLDDIKVCYHADGDRCACRKPKPGLLLAAAAEWTVDLTRSVMIGDRWRDIAAGKAAGCNTIWIANDYHERRPAAPDAIVPSLAEAATLICAGWAGTARRG